jgi:hypothetical protein
MGKFLKVGIGVCAHHSPVCHTGCEHTREIGKHLPTHGNMPFLSNERQLIRPAMLSDVSDG